MEECLCKPEWQQFVVDKPRTMDQQKQSDKVDHPSHYISSPAKCSGCGKPVECIDVTRHLNFNLGNAIKYIWRCELKGRLIEDLQKAIWYITDELKRREK